MHVSPFMDLAFAFSNNPATPWYAYVSNGTTIRRFDIRTMTEATGGGWPVTDASAMWLHQSENDALFVWMRGSSGTTVVGYEPSTGTLKTYTNAGLNEPRVDRAGRYVGISMTSPPNGLVVWDWQGNAVAWSTPGDPGPPFAHNASLRRRWMSVDWNISYPYAYSLFKSDVANSAVDLSGPTNGGQVHGNGNWIQHPADLGDQWAAFSYYGGLRPTETFWLAPGGCVLATANGQRRLLLHPYNTSANYTFFTFGKFSPDGSYLLFTSDMDGSGRSDLFLAEVPTSTGDATAPTVSLTAPAAGATVSGTAVSVSATAADNVAVVGVQFELDGANLGVEDTSSPYSVTWNTTTAANGSHSLTAVARDAAGNVTVSAAVAVTVSNVDTTPPVISAVAASGVSSADATVTWTTNEAADAQVDYGTTTAYGASTTLDATLALSHSQALKGLAANTTYHYRVRSKDAAGNLSLSADASFTTLASVDAGLLGYWKLDEGSGLTTADASGSGNTGSLVNGPVWTAGRIGQAVSLDGVDDYVNVPHVATLDPFPLSVAGWVQTSTTTGIKGFLNKYVPGSYNGYQIFFNNGDLCAWYLRDTADYVYDGGGCTMKASGYNNGQWHHVALVVDATGGRLYVDGLQKASQPWTGTSGAVTTTQALRFGDYPGIGATEYLPGAVDEVRLYSRALTPTEITLLATAAPDTTPPVISGMATSGITGTAATLTWTTNELADSQVDYGTTTAYGSSTALSATLVLAHSQAVSGLAASTVYHYRVRSKDAAGNLAVSGDATFKTLDTVPPTAAITVPAAGASETGTVTVSATAADDVGVVGVQFKLDGAVLGAEVLAAPYSVPWNTSASANGSHALTAVARDAAGNSTTSAAVAVTVSNADLTPPVISTVSATGITSSAATITWTTNEAADSQVDYGTTATYGSSTTLAAALATAHSQALAGLAAGTLHHYRVRSNDAAGNLALSPDATFTTLAVVPTIDVGVLAHWKLDEGSGTSALDSSGNGNTASLMNGAAWGSGRAGSGLLLDGVNDYASVPHAAALDAFPLSVSVWFKTSTHSGLRGVVNKYAAASANGYQIFFNSGRLCAWYFKDASDYVYDGGGCGLKAGAYNDDRWHQALLVVDAAGGKLYVDAALKASRSWTGTAGATATTQDVHLGDYPGVAAASAYLPGAIDEVRIYNRALSAAEAVQLYGELPPLVDVTPPLLTSVTVASQLPGSATITWNTDEAADSQVEYGTTTAYGTASPLASALVKPHTVTLSGLAPTTLYHYRAKSRDAAGNVGYSADFTFTSLAASTAGPIAYWALDETAGTIAADSSGNGNTGTLVNGPVWTAGHTAGGLSLDGIDDYVSVPHAAALNSFPLTVAVWFNTTTSSGVRGLVNKYVANAYNGYEIFFNDGNLCAWYLRDTADYVYDASGCALSTPGYNDGQWHQAVFVVDVSGGSLYVDGALKAAMPWTGVAGPVTTTQDIHLGHYPGAAGGAEYLPALIDEVRIYDIGMTPLRVLALFQHGN